MSLYIFLYLPNYLFKSLSCKFHEDGNYNGLSSFYTTYTLPDAEHKSE